MEINGITLNDFHRLECFETGFLCNLILAAIGIVLQMAHICNVAHVTHCLAQVHEVAENQVERGKGSGIPKVHVAIYGRSTYIHTHSSIVNGGKGFLFAGQAVFNVDGINFVQRFH